MYKIIEELLLEGFSQRAIAKKLEISRRTVSRYANMEMIESSAHYHKSRRLVQYPSGFDAAKEFIETKLTMQPKIRKIELYRQVMEHYPGISLTERAFYYYLDKLKSYQRIRKSRNSIFDPAKSREQGSYETINKVKQSQLVDDDDETNISLKVKKYREVNGLSKKDLAEKIGLTPSMITYYEQGKRNPSLRAIMKIAKVTRIPVEYYLTDKEYRLSPLSQLDKEKEVINPKKINTSKNSEIAAEVDEITNRAFNLRNSNPDECIRLGEKALQLSQENDYQLGIALANERIGSGCILKSDYSQALKRFLSAESIYIKEHHYKGLRSIYNSIGTVYYQWNDLENSLKYYQKSLQLEHKFSSPSTTSMVFNNIGIIYAELGQHKKALFYCKKSLEIDSAGAMDNIGKMYQLMGAKDKAEVFFKKSLSIAKEVNDLRSLSHVYLNFSELKLDTGQYDSAFKYSDKSIFYAQKMGDQSLIAKVYLVRASIYETMDLAVKQEEQLKKCIVIAESNDFRATALTAYEKLAAMYEKALDYKESQRCYKKILGIKEFLNNEIKTRAIEEIKTRMEVERTEKEKQLLSIKNIELQQKNDQIYKQKIKLEMAEKELIELNHNLELKVQEEIEKRRKQEQVLIQKSKLESLGQMAAGIAHEINQPLGLIQMATQNLFQKYQQRKITTEYFEEKSTFISENITRINKIIEHIRLFSREQKDIHKMFNIVDTLNDALSMVSAQFRNRNIKIDKYIEKASLETSGNKYRLEQVFINLLNNSRDALESKFDVYDNRKQISIRAYSESRKIILEIKDNGCGIDKELVKKVFDPFCTTKDESKGTGLGLSICFGIINDMKGRVSIESEKDKYTLVIIELPQY